MAAHARLSPSGAARWMTCAGSAALCVGIPDTSSVYADEGTAAHTLGSDCLLNDTEAQTHVGEVIKVGEREFTVDAEMAGYVQTYVDQVRTLAGHDGYLQVEQHLPIEQLTGEKGARGTADAVIARGDELTVSDLKYGMGVEVSAEENEQLLIYLLAAYDEFNGLLGEFKHFRLCIHQPRIREAPSEWTLDLAQLEAFREKVKAAAAVAMRCYNTANPVGQLHASEKACKFCPAKATCPELARFVQDELGADFETLVEDSDVATAVASLPTTLADSLPAKMRAIGLIEDFCTAVRAEVERRLLHGEPVPGYKLVEGKRSNRAWADATEAAATMTSMRLTVEEKYNLELKSPPQMEKVFKKESPRRWSRLAALIAPQRPGKPSVAPESDKRPALSMGPSSNDFADETGADLAL